MAFSEVNQNFFRLYYVVNEFGTKALNELLRYLVHQTIPSSSASTMTLSQFLALTQVMNDLLFPARTRNFLDPMQKDLLYPSGAPSMTLDYGDLDITLVTKLLKKLTVFSGVLKQPGSCSSRTLWTNPTVNDQSSYPLEANVVLLNSKRNSIAHSNEPSMPTEEFEANFDHVKSLVMNIMRMAGSVAFNEDDIEQYRTSYLLPEVFKETAEKLLENLEASKGLKDEVERLIQEQKQMEARLLNKFVTLTRKTSRRRLLKLFCMSLIFMAVFFLGILVWITREYLEQRFKELKQLISEIQSKNKRNQTREGSRS